MIAAGPVVVALLFIILYCKTLKFHSVPKSTLVIVKIQAVTSPSGSFKYKERHKLTRPLLRQPYIRLDLAVGNQS